MNPPRRLCWCSIPAWRQVLILKAGVSGSSIVAIARHNALSQAPACGRRLERCR